MTQINNKFTVNDMYEQTLSTRTPLLSQYTSPFWSEYNTYSDDYDMIFRRMFFSFRYYFQIDDDILSVTNRFREEVYSFLRMNDKKYSELYREYVIEDEDYDFMRDYESVEVLDRDTSRQDTTTIGEQTNTSSLSVGQQNNVSSEVLGSQSNSTSESIGSRNDSTTDKVAPFNTDTFYNSEKSDDSIGAQSNSTSETIGEKTNSSSETLGSRSDSTSSTIGNRTDGYSNSTTDDYTKTIKGKSPNKTYTDMIKNHNNYWRKYKFYEMIFNDIAEAFLLV